MRVHGALKRIAVGPFELVAKAIEGVTCLVEGVTKLPRQIGRRISKAHDATDAVEDEQQARLETRETTALRLPSAQPSLGEWIKAMRARGIPVDIADLGGGVIAIAVVRPEHRELAEELTRLQLPQLTGPDEVEHKPKAKPAGESMEMPMARTEDDAESAGREVGSKGGGALGKKRSSKKTKRGGRGK